MATANNTIKTRIRLKNDTEANWNKEASRNFVPLLGEIIIYTADATHTYSRLKVGDGITTVVNLPFIDSGTINGSEVEIVKENSFNDFPSPGNSDKLYIDLSTNKIYHYTGANGYTPLFNFSYTAVEDLMKWLPGRAASASIENNTLKIINGVAPELRFKDTLVLTKPQEVDNT